MSIVLYRLVRTNPPTTSDFLSDEARGELPPADADSEKLDMWRGVSCHTVAAKLTRRTRMVGNLPYLAEIELPDNCAIRHRQTGNNPGHHTIWGEPEELLGYVRHVERVRMP